MITPELLRELAIRHGVSETEFEVLSRVITGKAMSVVAADLEIDAAAARKRLGEVYRKFGIIGKGPGKLAKLQQLLLQQAQDGETALATVPSPTDHPHRLTQPADRMSKLPDDGLIEVDPLYGRTEELAKLEELILTERCRLIELIGLSGIGKTSLSLALAKRLYHQFDQVIRRSLSHAPALKDLLLDLLSLLIDDWPEQGLSQFQGSESELLELLLIGLAQTLQVQKQGPRLHGIQHLQCGNDLACGERADLELAVRNLPDALGHELRAAVKRVEALGPAGGEAPGDAGQASRRLCFDYPGSGNGGARCQSHTGFLQK